MPGPEEKQQKSRKEQDVELHRKYITETTEAKKDGILKAMEEQKLIKKAEFKIRNPLPVQPKSNKFVTIQSKEVKIEEKDTKVITYHIYSDAEGKIEKYTPQEIDKEYKKKRQYIVYQNDNLVYSCLLEKNEHDLFPFPENGYNWGRYGGRDKGGDNWIEEKTCAALLGFFYSLPKNNFKDTLYYNDISANDKRNIGHKTHRGGQDVDIRYPGSHNGSQVLWKEAMKKYKDEKEFVSVLENILYVSTLWGFNTNYAYKSDIKYTKGTAISVHQDHFHIGLR